MAKKRVHEIAKAQGLESKEVLAALKSAGIEAKAAASSVDEADALKAIQAAKGNGGAAAAPAETKKPAAAAPAKEAPAKPAPTPQAAAKPAPPCARSPSCSVSAALR